MRVKLLLTCCLAASTRVAGLDRCSACIVVADSLKNTLELEDHDEDKTDILSGGRLDSRGVRQGKVVDYRTSEFRTSHIMDQICPVAASYSLNSLVGEHFLLNRTALEAVAFSEHLPASSTMVATSFDEVEAIALRTFCDGMVETYEDDISKAILADSPPQAGAMMEEICVKSAACESVDSLYGTVEARHNAMQANEDKKKKHKTKKKKKKKKFKENKGL